MRLLVSLRFRGKLRAMTRGLRQPKRILMLIGGLTLMSFWIWATSHSSRSGGLLGGPHGHLALGAFLMFFPIISVWAAARQGVIAFSPEEVHFIFPGPVSTRVLLTTHLATNCFKSLTAAFFFALFIRPDGVSLAWAMFAYGLYLSFVVCLQVLIDIRFIGLAAPVRRRRARLLLAGMLATIGGGVALAALLTSDRGIDLIYWAVLPARPFVALMEGHGLTGTGVMASTLNAVGILVVIGAMAIKVLRFKGDVRESSHATSQKAQEKLRTIRRGKMFQDAPKERTSGSVIPMFPRLGGAGVHAWRQLSVLRRSRKSYTILIFMTLAMGVTFSFSARGEPTVIAGIMLGVLSFAGPMYVQCDFRSDYECLAWMRSFPSPPGILAAGQLLSSAIVLYLLQLVLGGWVVFVCPADQLLAWAGVLLMLPVFNLLQLSVWNGAHLIHPVRLVNQAGTPSISHMLRVYLTMLGVFATLFIALAITTGFGALTWWLLDRVAGLGPLPGVQITAGLVALTALCTVTAICIWCVGRLFVRVDPSIDLVD